MKQTEIPVLTDTGAVLAASYDECGVLWLRRTTAREVEETKAAVKSVTSGRLRPADAPSIAPTGTEPDWERSADRKTARHS